MWLFGVMDTESRFMVRHTSSPSKFGYDAEPLFAGATELAGKEPDAVTADTLPGFAKRLAAALTGGKRSRTIRRKDAGIRKRHADNNVYERFNGTVKDRLRRVRGFRSELSALHVLFLTHYNLLRPHSGMGGKGPRRGVGRGNRRAKQVAHGHTARGPLLRVAPCRARVRNPRARYSAKSERGPRKRAPRRQDNPPGALRLPCAASASRRAERTVRRILRSVPNLQ